MPSKPCAATPSLVLGLLLACSSQSAPSPPAASGGSGAVAGTGGSAGSSAGSNATGGDGGMLTAGAGGTEPAGGSAGSVAGSSGSGGSGVSLPFGHPNPATVYPTYDGFTLWLVEEFDEPLDLDADAIWTFSDGGFQTHRFRKEAITFEAGKMVLTLSETPQPASCSYSNTGNIPERARTSGELRSKHNWFRYGRYEATLKAPSVQPGNPTINGNYIASLFVYRQPACQEWREIDLEVTGDSPNHLGTNLIIADNDCTFTSDKEQPQFFDVEGRDFRTTFQTIGFEWLPGAIRFYYLGDAGEVVQLREITGADVPALSTKIMANLWVFDDSFAFGGPEGENNQYPLRAEYESLRFYRWDQDTEYPCDDMSTACLKPEDLDMVGNNVCDGVPEIGDVGSCVQCGTTVRALCGETCE